MTKKRKAWIVMGNDYPSDVVFTNEKAANEYVAKKKAERPGSTIYWRHYECDLVSRAEDA